MDEDPYGPLDGKAQAPRLGSGQLIVDQDEDLSPGKGLRETQEMPLSCIQGRDRHIFLEDFLGDIDDWEVVAFEEEADAERIRRIAEPSFKHGFLIDRPGDVNGS